MVLKKIKEVVYERWQIVKGKMVYAYEAFKYIKGFDKASTDLISEDYYSVISNKSTALKLTNEIIYEKYPKTGKDLMKIYKNCEVSLFEDVFTRNVKKS